MLRTRPGKGREKLPPAPPRPRPVKKKKRPKLPPIEYPVIESEADFDRVLRGLLGVPKQPPPDRRRVSKRDA